MGAMKKKLKSYNFWVKLMSALILIARIILSKFGYELDSAFVLDIATLVAGGLVILGIINEPTGFTISSDGRIVNLNEECENTENIINVEGEQTMQGKIKEDLTNEVKDMINKLNSVYGDFGTSQPTLLKLYATDLLKIVDEVKRVTAENSTVNESSETAQVENFEDDASVGIKLEVNGEKQVEENEAKFENQGGNLKTEKVQEVETESEQVNIKNENAENVKTSVTAGGCDIKLGETEKVNGVLYKQYEIVEIDCNVNNHESLNNSETDENMHEDADAGVVHEDADAGVVHDDADAGVVYDDADVDVEKIKNDLTQVVDGFITELGEVDNTVREKAYKILCDHIEEIF